MNQKKTDKIGGWILGVIIVTIVFTLVALFGGAIMKVFGFEYDSIWSIILYFIVVSVVTWPLDLLVSALPKALLSFQRVTRPMAIAIYLVMDIALSCLGYRVIDYFMDSVSATDTAIFILAIIFSVLGIDGFEETKDKEKNDDEV